MQTWIEQELATANIGDERLNERYKIILDRLSCKPSVSIPNACRGWSETLATYRFFDNARVDAHALWGPHHDATLMRIGAHDVALLIEDTTELNLTCPQDQMAGAGPLNGESRVGFLNHVMLAVTPQRLSLGVVDAHIYARDWETFRANQKDKTPKAKRRKQKPIEEKESVRWLEGYRRGCQVAKAVPETTVVVISDSEGDIYECFSEAQPQPQTQSQSQTQPQSDQCKAEWIVRGCQNRCLTSESGNKLWEQVSSSDVLGTIEIAISKNRSEAKNKSLTTGKSRTKDTRKRKQPRSARTATLTIQTARVMLKGPYRPGGKLADVAVNAVLVRETNPPKDEAPVEWLLLTSLPIATFEQARLVTEYYSCRWQIEIYFRVLKSGCGVEKLQLETAARFEPCLALYMIVAWRVMHVMMMGRTCCDAPCDLILSDDEWRAVYTIVAKKSPPAKVPTINEMVYMIASLGGHLGRKHDGPPGPKTMWIGMQRMTDFAQAWRIFGPANPLDEWG